MQAPNALRLYIIKCVFLKSSPRLPSFFCITQTRQMASEYLRISKTRNAARSETLFEHAHHNYGQHQQNYHHRSCIKIFFCCAHAASAAITACFLSYLYRNSTLARLGRQHNIAANNAAAAGRHRCGHSSASQHSYVAAEQLPAHKAVTMQIAMEC
jgi:hypothetical protein